MSSNSNTPAPAPAPPPAPEPTIVEGHQYHSYGSDRYSYIGKDADSGEPEFVDWGPKGGRK